MSLQYLPKVLYTTDEFTSSELATNLISQYSFIRNTLETAESYYPYIIKDGITPQQVANEYYGDSKYVWIVYAYNQMVDPQWEWPLDEQSFRRYLVREYGSVEQAKTTVKYYKCTAHSGRTFVVDHNAAYDSVEYAYDFEVNLNESRRTIQLLDNIYVTQIEKQVKELMANG
jgi:hypothetical protein